MIAGYVCKKCRKYFSQTDFDKNNCCPDCGRYLLKRCDSTIQARNAECSSEFHGLNMTRVAENLRNRTEQIKEYTIVPEFSKSQVNQGSGSEGWIFGCELDDALRLRNELTTKFKGKTLQEAIPGKIVSNDHGDCYCIRQNHLVQFKTTSPEESRRKLLSDLKLLPGIGQMREKSLRQQGYRTIEDLTGHLKWRKSAMEFLRLVDSKNVMALQNHLRRTLPKSHPLLHYLAGFCDHKDIAVIDIETLGLFGRPIILVGLAQVTKRGICTRQLLARDVSEESAALWELSCSLKLSTTFVSYNGRCFDLPFIGERMAFYGLNLDQAFDKPHFDMLHFARRALKGKLISCRLEAVEKYLGISRNVNIPGALVPEFYDFYQRSGNVGPLVAIVEHNKQDLITLSKLFCALFQEWNLQ